VNTRILAKRSSFTRYANFSERNLFSRQNFVQQGMIDHLGGGHGFGDLLSLAREIDWELHAVGAASPRFSMQMSSR